jgi:hypothetical protein
MIEYFEPELGQAIFGQPYQELGCPEYIIALLQYLEYDMELCECFDDGDSPFRNTGNRYANDVFQVEAYCWDEEVQQPWNFKYQDIEISWYKWLGRGTSINRKITPEEAIEMFEVCLKSVREGDEDDFGMLTWFPEALTEIETLRIRLDAAHRLIKEQDARIKELESW